jgi:hypothetical protein
LAGEWGADPAAKAAETNFLSSPCLLGAARLPLLAGSVSKSGHVPSIFILQLPGHAALRGFGRISVRPFWLTRLMWLIRLIRLFFSRGRRLAREFTSLGAIRLEIVMNLIAVHSASNTLIFEEKPLRGRAKMCNHIAAL